MRFETNWFRYKTPEFWRSLTQVSEHFSKVSNTLLHIAKHLSDVWNTLLTIATHLSEVRNSLLQVPKHYSEVLTAWLRHRATSARFVTAYIKHPGISVKAETAGFRYETETCMIWIRRNMSYCYKYRSLWSSGQQTYFLFWIPRVHISAWDPTILISFSWISSSRTCNYMIVPCLFVLWLFLFSLHYCKNIRPSNLLN
jgi:hypothetical protein